MIAIISLLIILTLSIIITRIATVMLTHTGLSREASRFQARSAFTGVGFTTSESEKVVAHPVRRRVLMTLMLLGNAGIATSVASLILSFVSDGEGPFLYRILLLFGGLMVLLTLASSSWIDRRLSSLIGSILKKYTSLDVKDYASLLHLHGDYRVTELQVKKRDWIADRALSELKLRDEGIVVLGIEREDGTYIGTPVGETKLRENDVLVLYGRIEDLEKLDRRRRGKRGDMEHGRAVARHEEVVREETEKDSSTE